MNETSNVLRGILHPDGTLELAERPTLPAGDVEVTIRPTSEVAKGKANDGRPIQPIAPNGSPDRRAGETLWEFMHRTRAELEASGYEFFRTKEEVDAYIEEMRDWGEERIEAVRTHAEGYGPYLTRIRARREADGFPFRTKAEIDAEIEELRSWDEEPEEKEHREAEG